MTKDAEDFMDENRRWVCTRCTACCRMVSDILPDLDRGDGVCSNLGLNGKCLIYEDRPAVCRVENFPATEKQKASACAAIYNIVFGHH